MNIRMILLVALFATLFSLVGCLNNSPYDHDRSGVRGKPGGRPEMYWGGASERWEDRSWSGQDRGLEQGDWAE